MQTEALAPKVVVVIVDGLPADLLERTLPDLPFLRSRWHDEPLSMTIEASRLGPLAAATETVVYHAARRRDEEEPEPTPEAFDDLAPEPARYAALFWDEIQSYPWPLGAELSRRLVRIFLRDGEGRRPVNGMDEKFRNDPHWRDLILFPEYFHGESGAGLGASHQTGWTALVAKLLEQSGE